MTQQLDPNPRNELGKGILDPAQEKQLLEQGYIYARRIFLPNGKSHLRLSKSPIKDVANRIALDALKFQLNNTIVFDEPGR